MIIAPKGHGWAAIVSQDSYNGVVALLKTEESPSEKSRNDRRWSVIRRQVAKGPAVRVGGKRGRA